VSGWPDVLVVGAGLSGLMTALLAAQRGARVMVVARGVGGTHTGNGCVGVLGYTPRGTPVTSPSRTLTRALKDRPNHPYPLAGREALEIGMAALKAACDAAGYPLAGDLSANLTLPTALGALAPVCLAPASMAAGHQHGTDGDEPPWTLVGLAGWRDFDAGYAAANLGAHVRALDFAPPGVALDPNLTPLEVARRFDQPGFRSNFALGLSRMLNGEARVGFPAVLGLRRTTDVVADLEETLGCPVFEIPTVPPSVPGVRLYNALRQAVLVLGGEVVLGPRVAGWMERGQLQGVGAHGPGGERKIRAGAVVLATGGLLGGGLEADLDGTLRETVFELPVDAPPPDEWFDPLFFGHHPVFESGVRVNSWMQPLDGAGEVVSTRLYAVGGLLGDADRLGERSAEGIALATAAKAVEVLAA
jgi:glycerol-3-phosphate dehydrogenase subunit B